MTNLEYPPAPERMKSDQVRLDWKNVLQRVRSGGTIEVEHYNQLIGRITPYLSTDGIHLYTITLTAAQWQAVGVCARQRLSDIRDRANQPSGVEEYRELTHIAKGTEDEIGAMPVTVMVPLGTATAMTTMPDVAATVQEQLTPQLAEADRVAKLRRAARRAAIRAHARDAR